MSMESIKDRLAQILRSKNLTASQFAELMEIQPSNVSHLLNGRNKPSLDFLIKLKEVFPEYNFDWIILGKKPMTHVENSSNISQTKLFDEKNVSEETNDVLEFPIDGNDTYITDNQHVEHDSELESHKTTAEKLIILYKDRTFEFFDAR